MALAVNELATNAIKYGALSASGGKVDIGWSLEEADGVAAFRFQMARARRAACGGAGPEGIWHARHHVDAGR